jgi:branched-chain amino acid transport system ATP-binding protein
LKEIILSCRKLTKEFGGVRALNMLDIDIVRGSIHGLIGPNGSGKTTLFNVISGLLPSTKGEIRLEGKDITNQKPFNITKQGVSRTFQKAQLLPSLSCLENVMVGSYCQTALDMRGTFLRWPFTSSPQEDKIKQRAMELLAFVGVAESAKRWASELVWVETQLLQIARALAAEPKLLLLDEPSAGMGDEEKGRVEEIILQIRDSGVTIVLVAHDTKLVARISDSVTAINFGEKVSEGTPHHVLRDPKVAEAYLGNR